MKILQNALRGRGLSTVMADGIPEPSTDADRPLALLQRCPRHAETPLVDVPPLARDAGVGHVLVKDERTRMGLGSFKALGAAYVVARDAEAGRAAGQTYIAASAGNHGLSVAAGAAAFGAQSVICIADTVPEAFADRLRAQGGEVVRQGGTYEDSMAAAAARARENGWVLLSDSSWPGYTERPHILMEGYLVLMAEVIARIAAPPTHILLQAGVGGLAAAAAAGARAEWGDAPHIVVVEPEAAPALAASVEAGRPLVAPGPVSCMGRLDCKEPSLIALKGLAKDADAFATLTEAEALSATEACARVGLASTPSGTAGIAALLASGPHRAALKLTPDSRVLVVLSEGPE